MNSTIEIIEEKYDSKICAIIKRVGAEYGAVGEGYGPSDPEVEAMSQFYHDKMGSRYFVAMVDGVIVGGGGIAAFDSDIAKVCELRKLFLLPESRGGGLGTQLLQACLLYAQSKGYEHCYLDTLSSMQAAITLYEKQGFVHLEQPLQGTIHGACDVWMLKAL